MPREGEIISGIEGLEGPKRSGPCQNDAQGGCCGQGKKRFGPSSPSMPREGKLIRGIEGLEGPNRSVPCQTGAHVVVLGNVLRVVEVDKLKPPHLVVHG